MIGETTEYAEEYDEGADAPVEEEVAQEEPAFSLDDYFMGYEFPVESLETSYYATIEGLVEFLHYNPFLGEHYFETEDFSRIVSQFESGGMLPLTYDLIEDDEGAWESVTFALNAYDHDQLRDHDSITINVDDFILPLLNGSFGFHTEMTRGQISFVALNNEQFAQLARFVQNREERRQFVLGIDDDTNGREALHALLIKAIKARASDIHIEPLDELHTRVRYRIDGVLHDQRYRFTLRRLASIISALKVDADLNISERRKPQDGGIRYVKAKTTASGEEEEEDGMSNYNVSATTKAILHGRTFRVSTIPLEYGEKSVVRILAEQKKIDLRELGFSGEVYDSMIERIQTPHGIMLVTGPTGSGKTTTLYSCLDLRNSDDVNIVTIEDPVEVSMNGVNQSNVNRAVDWTFQNAIRAFLRQDPDVILVGEIRDSETAQTAVEAAKTGHLVFSTLHTNNSIGALLRLKELGVDNSDLYTCLHSVLAQRLVRRLAPKYAEEEDVSGLLSRLTGETVDGPVMVKKPQPGLGVEESYGYQGRIPVVEIWNIDDEERGLIFEGCRDDSKYMEVALRKGMEPLVVDGIKKVLNGDTSMSEVIRSVPAEDFRRFKDQILNVVRNRPM